MAGEVQIRIRKAVPTDADVIAAFNLAMAAETERRQLDRATVLAGVRRLFSDSGHGVYYLAELSGRCVGQLLITYEWSDWRNGRFWWIQSVYVTPAARGRGVYRALHEWVARLARDTPGVCGLRLYVDRANTTAQAVYGQLGLTPTNYELMEVAWSDDPAVDPPAGEQPAPPTAAYCAACGFPLDATGGRPDECPECGHVYSGRDPRLAEDIDLYCLECGYNLRGLSGDPRRCPECGYRNPIGDLMLPADMITRQLRQMETPLAGCALTMLFILAALALAMVMLVRGSAPARAESLSLLLGVTCVASVGWVAGCLRFRETCQRKVGWLGAFWKYQFYAVLLSAMVAGAVLLLAVGVGRAALRSVHTGGGFTGGRAIMGLMSIGVLAAVGLIVRHVYRRLRASIDPLQREMAVRIARQYVRRKMSHGRRRFGLG